MINPSNPIALPSRLTDDVLDLDDKQVFWHLISGGDKLRKAFITARVNACILELYSGYEFGQLDCIAVGRTSNVCYLRPRIKTAVLCKNWHGDEQYLTADTIGLLATALGFRRYAEKYKSPFVAQCASDLLTHTGQILGEYIKNTDGSTVRRNNGIHVKHNAIVLKKWLRSGAIPQAS